MCMYVLQELRGRLVRPEHHNQSLYGATNPAFFSEDAEDEKENDLFGNIPKTLPCQTDDEIVQEDKPEDERESWDSKLMFLLATIGYARTTIKTILYLYFQIQRHFTTSVQK